MERRVKERLIGAAVLMAAAIVLIPEMLSGPRRDARGVAAQPASDAPLKTYTIDLNRSPGTPATSQIDERAPPPESEQEPQAAGSTVPDPRSSENPTPTTPQVNPEPRSSAPEPPQGRVVAEAAQQAAIRPQQVAPPAESPVRDAPKPIASGTIAPTSRGWAVQLGSFASRATADRMVKDLSQQGQSAFVMPVKSGTSTLYRVRVGPFADRTAANQALLAVKGRVANAAVVAHP